MKWRFASSTTITYPFRGGSQPGNSLIWDSGGGSAFAGKLRRAKLWLSSRSRRLGEVPGRITRIQLRQKIRRRFELLRFGQWLVLGRQPDMGAKSASRLHFERELWRGGVEFVAGVDEAGCGPLAGP